MAGCSGSSNPDPRPNVPVALTMRRESGGGGKTVAAEATSKGTDWGSLKGVFVYQGTPPALKALSTGGKDPGVCDVHPVPDQSLVVHDSTKGIANIVVYA